MTMTNIWDSYRPSQAHKIGVRLVVLLDESGSLADRTGHDIIRTGHAIKRAMDNIKAPCSVYLFSNRTRVLYTDTDVADESCPERVCAFGGSTIVDEALTLAARDFVKGPEAYKVLITLTDGGFTGNFIGGTGSMNTYWESMALLHKVGVSSHVLLYGYDPEDLAEQIASRGYQYGAIVKKPLDVVTYAHDFLIDHLTQEVN